ncbi:MAG: prepilin-type N-terminal cleavage/methylation domain-containing protein [Agathobacter sp.]|nr:prepilin-type N-terminal cleavage/methylation domain-containing protein [Agathobacter sp.]
MKQNKTVRKNHSGFSLLEVVLSMSILAIISLPLLKYFADSLKYSHMMELKQQATVEAQAIVEDLKVQGKLIDKTGVSPSGADIYGVPYLEDASMGYTVVSNNLLSDGTGNVSYKKTDENFDIEVTLSTDTVANTNERPIIYGIDDTTDVLAVEKMQKEEAIAFFAAKNSAHVVANPSDHLFTMDEIGNAMRREIQIEIGKDTSGYTVCVYYVYKIDGLTGTSSTDEWTSSHLLNVRIGELKNIYLLYDQSSANDAVYVKNVSATPLTELPELYLICQNPRVDGSYRLLVDLLDTSEVVHTNIRAEKGTGLVTYGDGTINTNTKELTSEGTPVRLINVEAKIYEKNHASTDEPLAVIETTKGE